MLEGKKDKLNTQISTTMTHKSAKDSQKCAQAAISKANKPFLHNLPVSLIKMSRTGHVVVVRARGGDKGWQWTSEGRKHLFTAAVTVSGTKCSAVCPVSKLNKTKQKSLPFIFPCLPA